MRAARILVADDHAVVRRGLRGLLEAQLGWRVCGEACNGLEAIEKAKQLKPDVVILDISMPELNGLDAASLILAAVPQTQILILTMHSSNELIERVLEVGARGYVLKSEAERDLVAAVDALTQNKPFFSPLVSEFMLDHFQRTGEQRIPEEGTATPRSLTSREREVTQLLAEGKSNKETAEKLGISVRTVESHRARIMEKLECESFGDLVRYAVRKRLVNP